MTLPIAIGFVTLLLGQMYIIKLLRDCYKAYKNIELLFKDTTTSITFLARELYNQENKCKCNNKN